MNNKQEKKLSETINEGVQKPVIKAVDRHRKLGESITIWQDGKTVILSPQEIEKNYQNLLSN
jgi:hypothetical protein